MNINMVKQPGGILIPATDEDSERLKKFKSGHMYPVTIKLPRNPSFHGKVFKFFQYCFEHWDGGNQFQDEKTRFDGFRKDMTIQAGYSIAFYNLSGEVRLEAQSLSYGSMSQDDFETLYQALIQVAMDQIFLGNAEGVYMKLARFF